VDALPAEKDRRKADTESATLPLGSAFEKAVKATRSIYEGANKKKGEVETNAYLQRAYPDFNALSASGEFADLAETLLRPLQHAMPAKGKTTDKPVEQTESGAAS
jgi:exodeoxyribonuclease V gamma subunit